MSVIQGSGKRPQCPCANSGHIYCMRASTDDIARASVHASAVFNFKLIITGHGINILITVFLYADVS